MKKIILAAVSAIAVLAMSSAAEASRYHGKRNHYSSREVAGEEDILGDLFGGLSTPSIIEHASPRIEFKSRKQARRYYQQQEETYGEGFGGNYSGSLVAFGRQLQHQGLRVSEHPAFGGVHRVHHGHAHYEGRAIDVNVGRGVYEARSGYAHRFDQLAADARAAGYTVLWRVPGHYNHMHIQR